MKLYHSPSSPFARKCTVLLHEAGQPDSVELAPAAGHPVDPQTMPVAQNPLGKLPALERPDGPALYDSRVITRYLDARLEAGLYPDERLWDVLTVEATGDGMMDALILLRYETWLRPEEARWEDWAEGQWTKVRRACAALTERWMSHLQGPVDMGQVSVACALAYADFRHSNRDWRTGHEPLADWYADFSSRESMVATSHDG